MSNQKTQSSPQPAQTKPQTTPQPSPQPTIYKKPHSVFIGDSAIKSGHK